MKDETEAFPFRTEFSLSYSQERPRGAQGGFATGDLSEEYGESDELHGSYIFIGV